MSGDRGKEILARKQSDLGCCAVLLKGGHKNSATSDDLFVSRDYTELLSSVRIDSKILAEQGVHCLLPLPVSLLGNTGSV